MAEDRVVKPGISINIVDPKNGEYLVFTEGQRVPGELVELTDNDNAWLKEEDVDTMDALLRMARIATAANPEGDDFVPQFEAQDDFDNMKVGELREYADTHGIELGDATKKDDIVEALRAQETNA